MKERFESVRKMTVAWRKGDVTKISAYIYIYTHTHTHTHTRTHNSFGYIYIYIRKSYVCVYRMSQEEWTKLRESVPYVSWTGKGKNRGRNIPIYRKNIRELPFGSAGYKLTPGFKPWLGQDILPSSYTSRIALGPTHPPLEMLPLLIPGSKAAGVWRWRPTTI